MIKNNKGFTLIELLAVIVILAVIALIAVPVITTIINDARLNSMLNNMRNLIDAGEKYYAINGYQDTECMDVNSSELEFKNSFGEMNGLICFDGNETYLKDVLHENYLINGTTDSLEYVVVDDTIQPVYTLNEQYLDGVDDYVDTGYALYDTEKDFTIVISVTANLAHHFTQPPTIFHCLYESITLEWPGIVFDQRFDRGRLAGQPEVVEIFSQSMINNKSILVIKRDVEAGKYTFYVYGDDGTIISRNIFVTNRIFNQNLIIGAYQSTDGVKGRFFKGTIHHFGLYFEALDEVKIKSIMLDLK